MGHYYKPCSLASNKKSVKSFIYSHDIKSRWKTHDGRFVTTGQGLKLMEHSWLTNKMMLCVERLLTPGGEWHKTPIVWAGDYADPIVGERNYFDLCTEGVDGEHVGQKLIPKPLTKKEAKEFQFIVNHTKKEFVDKAKVPSIDGWQIHPLSLLTAQGNGRGGGDFRNDKNKFVGRWATDIISVEKEVPKGYKEIKPNFVED